MPAPPLDPGLVVVLAGRIFDCAPSVGPVRLVCVDGPAGSGKTTLAASLRTELAPHVGDVPVVHGDEVYEGWRVAAGTPDRVAAFDRLAARLDAWLLTPFADGLDGVHPVWDWYAGSWGAQRTVPAAPVVLLEGVALGSRTLRQRAVLSVWVDADEAVRLDRVLDRDGEALRDEMLAWQVDEGRWFALDGTRAGADVTLST